MPTFFIRGLRVGPLHLSIVRNVELFRLAGLKRFGGFFTWDRRWACGTLRIGSVCFNLDFDAR